MSFCLSRGNILSNSVINKIRSMEYRLYGGEEVRAMAFVGFDIIDARFISYTVDFHKHKPEERQLEFILTFEAPLRISKEAGYQSVSEAILMDLEGEMAVERAVFRDVPILMIRSHGLARFMADPSHDKLVVSIEYEDGPVASAKPVFWDSLGAVGVLTLRGGG